MGGPLLRAPILWLTERPLVRRLVAESALGQRVAHRFVAGETLQEAIDAAGALNRRKIGAMLDLLGENVGSLEEATAAADEYALALKRIAEENLPDATISIKLTQLGLDQSEEQCLANAERVLDIAAEQGRTVMIDMEAFPYVEPTLRCYRTLRERHPNVGVCVQAYLHRSADDVRQLTAEGATVRLCKGAYLEPPSVAMQSKEDVDRAYARLAATLLAGGATLHLATHDPRLIHGARSFVERRDIDPDRIEFQMLYGIRTDLQRAMEREGYEVRVYIPYGTEWYPYLTRRLAERPANVWFFASNLLRRSR